MAAAPASIATLVGRFDAEVFDARRRLSRIRLAVGEKEVADAIVEHGRAVLAAPSSRPDTLLRADAHTWAKIAADAHPCTLRTVAVSRSMSAGCRLCSGPDRCIAANQATDQEETSQLAAGRELLRLLLQDHLNLRARQEEHQVRAGAGPTVTGPEGRVRPWREAGHSRWRI